MRIWPLAVAGCLACGRINFEDQTALDADGDAANSGANRDRRFFGLSIQDFGSNLTCDVPRPLYCLED